MNDAQLRSMITMGKVAGTKVGPHTLMQITGLDGVSQQTVLLLLPPGYSARPLPGSDLALLQVLGSGDHVIGLGGAQEGHAIADLVPGEIGLTDGTQMVILRTDHIQVVSPTKVRFECPRLECTGEIVARCDGNSVSLTTHRHAGGAVPDPHT